MRRSGQWLYLACRLFIISATRQDKNTVTSLLELSEYEVSWVTLKNSTSVITGVNMTEYNKELTNMKVLVWSHVSCENGNNYSR